MLLSAPLQNTSVQGAISHLFEGHMQSFVECENIEYKSARRETYMDLSLEVSIVLRADNVHHVQGGAQKLSLCPTASLQCL